MPFTVRVVLHNGSEVQYTSLHAEMKARGFTRFIQNRLDQWLHLPPAEYRYEGTAAISSILDKAKAAGAASGLLRSVLVTENVDAESVMFEGLEPAGPFELAIG